ncbi:MAG: hypothetical protein ACXWUN_01720 [Allosphingosinicella sp.]
MTGRQIWLTLVAALLVLAGTVFLLRGPEPDADKAGPEPVAQNGPAPADGEVSETEAGKGRPPALPDLASILVFSPECELGEPLLSIFDRLVVFDPQTSEASRGGPLAVPGFEAAVVPTFEREIEPLEPGGHLRHITAGLALRGTWHGLRVSGLQFDFYEESDVGGRQIRFAEPPERVREVLVGQGFDLLPVGEFREIEGDGMRPSIGIERTPDGAALTCTSA